ncbi:MAG: ATP-binding protein [Ferruginibacter sp.]
MKKVLLHLLLFVSIIPASGQNVEIEGLRKILATHSKQDTFRVNRLNELAGNTAMPYTEAEKFAAEALFISRKTGYAIGEGYALANMGIATVYQGNTKQGFLLNEQADTAAKKTRDPDLLAYVLLIQGRSKLLGGNKGAQADLLNAENALEKTGNKKLLSRCQVYLSNFNQITLSNYPKAMEYALKANRSAEEANSPETTTRALTSLGNIYVTSGDFDNALICYKKAIEENKKIGNNNIMANLQSNTGEIYRLTGKYPEAIAAYRLAMEYDKAPRYTETNESNIADVYVRTDRLPLAFQYAFKSLKTSREIDDLVGVAWINGILARAYLKEKMPDSTIYYALHGLDTAKQTGTIEYMRDNAEALANAYAFKKDFANAYSYHLRYINYRDSMVNEEVRNKTAVLQYNYDREKTQAQITTLRQEKKSQQAFLFSSLIVLLVIIITAILLLRNNRQKQRANKLLQQQKQEIDNKATELSVQKDNVELLGDIGRKITSSLSVEKIIGTVYDNVNSLMDAAVFGIGIYHDSLKRLEFPATYEEGKPLPFYANSIDDKNRFGPACFNKGKEIIIGNLDKEYKDHIQEVTIPHEGGQPASLIFLPLTVKEKKLGVITIQSFQQNAYSDYQLFMLRNIAIYTAIALENAESYETLSQTFVSLKSTQTQLIQSEKMASLGELTAGIAHEIQNPLNFVNNFSEVNTELIEELEQEVDKGNLSVVKSIAKDIKENEQKINHHGKRADAIVKGMLQHSRSSTGIKEPTDINALVDEYIRLCYHGLRVKDKSFNATIKTDLDPSIEKLNIIPQDIGRVILNILNNAFFAVDEKRRSGIENYDPTVSVNTNRINDIIEISIADNGNGVAQNLVDKIFQPFFTTKPTGQGTGLGLSLSYDIIKAHGGEIKVETKESEFTEFVILLPLTVQV